MPKKSNKSKSKKKKSKSEEPVPKEFTKIKTCQHFKFDPVLSLNMYNEMKNSVDKFYEEYDELLKQKGVLDEDNIEENGSNINQKEKSKKENENNILNEEEPTKEVIKFNNNFYPKLQSVIKQIDVIKDKDTKNGNIQKGYEWYLKQKDDFKKIHQIKCLTKKSVFDSSEDVVKKDNKIWEAKQFPIKFEEDHRTIDENNFILPKQR